MLDTQLCYTFPIFAVSQNVISHLFYLLSNGDGYR